MMHRSADVIRLLQGKTLGTAESCTGGMIGACLTAVAGSSAVFSGGIISYSNRVKKEVLGVCEATLDTKGAVCAEVAQQMARGARNALGVDIAVSVTGLAGPGGDDFGHPVGMVFIGYCDDSVCISREYLFVGDREQIRLSAVEAALNLIISQNQ
jgi:PncC family amidohydrolase